MTERKHYATFLMLGVLALLPWNFFIMPFSFWMSKLQDPNWKENRGAVEQVQSQVTDQWRQLGKILDNAERRISLQAVTASAGTLILPDFAFTIERSTVCTPEQEEYEQNQFQKFWNFDLAVTTTSASLVFSILTSVLAKRLQRAVKCLFCLCGSFICLLGALISCLIDTHNWIENFFFFGLGLALAITIFCAIFQVSLFGLASVFPEKFGVISAVLIGQGIGGVLSVGLHLISIATLKNPNFRAMIFFSLGSFIVGLGILLCMCISRDKDFQRYLIERTFECDSNESLIIDGIEAVSRSDSQASKVTSSADSDQAVQKEITSFSELVQHKTWSYFVTIFLVYTVTLSLFPAVAAQIQPVAYDCTKEYHTKWYTALWCIFLFNSGDAAGRIISGKTKEIHLSKGRRLLFAALFRMLFLVLLPMCNIRLKSRKTPVIIHNDVAYIIIMGLMSLSGGFIASHAFRYAIKASPGRFAHNTGCAMAVTMMGGILTGVCLSFAIVAAI